MKTPKRRSALERHVELERTFGTDFLPLSRRTPVAPPPASRAPTPLRSVPAAPRPQPAATPLPAEFAKFRDDVLACRKCGLCETRTQVVFGVGTLQAPVVFVGEAPGADEDRLGEPFVGRAGQILTQSLAKIGVRRDQVYIANILKCRPPDNRTPRPDEMAACLPYLLKQLDWIKPGRICALGNVAVQALLGTTQGISRLRGQYHDFQGRKLFATFHPAYVLRNMSQAPVFEGDLRTVCRDAGLIA
jgi:uracil-DNA glycosylase family 4